MKISAASSFKSLEPSMDSPAPSELRYRKEARELALTYSDGEFLLSAEFLRVHSPSAEVQGHDGHGGELPRNKGNVAITAIEPVGNYAVKLCFSDGHDTGLYSWDWLRELCLQKDQLWRLYQDKLAVADGGLNPQESSVKQFDPRK
jgi:DUF971 family protein